jgi:hypothetical protein
MIRKILFVLLAAVLTAGSAMAQKFGVQAGYNLSDYWGGDAPNSNMKPGFQAGLLMQSEQPDANKLFVRNLSSQIGLLFIQQGAKVEDFGEQIEMTLNYLRLPINAQYKFDLGENFAVYAQVGVYIAYALSGNQKTEIGGEWENEKVNFKENNMQRLDSGAGIGAGVRIANSVLIGVEKNWSLTPLIKTDPVWVSMFNTNLAITATFLFGRSPNY